ncbi:MAG: hypothetical protein HN390_12545 [Anaerolineae bacterium]|jgi:hypothetical protein|nr:hypothetical protein [Anaerolineae bacterium]MBT7192063.1 hypothetical protein [Anaerolineae bacterium]MBT7990139.1 hypothetical protein [Anaerolineae bacterium]
MTKEEKNISNGAESILVAEYEYIAQTAFQAHEDRARVTTFYLVSVGSLFGAFLGVQNIESVDTFAYIVLAGLFLFLSAFGLLTLLQLARLRKAWFSSTSAMNHIKEFISKRNNGFEKAFLWNNESLPDLYKKESVAYLMALQVSMLGAITFGAMIFYASLAFNQKLEITPSLFIVALLGGLIFLKLQMNLYLKELTQKK